MSCGASKKLTHLLRSVINFFDALQLVNEIVHALFPWNNLNLCGSRKSLCSFTNQDWDEKVWMVVLIGNFHDNYKQINIIIIMEF